MSVPFPPPDPHEDADEPAVWERALLDHQLAELSRLAAMGMELAQAITRRATVDEPEADLGRAAMDFSRASRAVRLSFALQSRLIAEFKARPRAAEDAEDESGPMVVRWIGERSRDEQARQGRIQRAVGRAAEDAGFDRDEIWDALKHRPFDQIVALICEDLGLAAYAARPPPPAGEPVTASPGFPSG